MSSDGPHSDTEVRTAGKARALFGFVLGIFVIGVGIHAVVSLPGRKPVTLSNAAVSEALVGNPFADVVLEARAAYVWDSIRKEVLFSKNEEAQLPLASLTKLMTALVAYEALPENTLIPVTLEAIRAEGDSGLRAGERWSLSNLVNFTLLVSSNDGAAALAHAAGARGSANALDPHANIARFVSHMNVKAHEIGLSQTFFVNETGLDTHDYASGSYGSARDITRLMEYILREEPRILEATQYRTLSFTSSDGAVHRAENTNTALSGIPALLASKTGFTDLAGGNLVIAFDAGLGHPVVITVLGSSETGRFRDVIKLVRASLESLE